MAGSRKLWIEGPVGRLEAAMRTSSPARGAAVLAHPHPLHGGSLHNPVIFHAERGLNRAGLTTLRFNFRGVGTSEGEHDDRRGEVDDLAAAVTWMRGIEPDAPLILVGYSFGAWCAIRHAVDNGKVSAIVAIGLPVTQYAFTEVEGLGCPLAVVQGSADELGDASQVRGFLDRVKPEAHLRVIEGTTHLFPGRTTDAAEQVVELVETLLI